MLNEKFKSYAAFFYFQISLAVVLVFLILLAMGHISQTAILGAIGSSSLASSIFIICAFPKSRTASARSLIGSYFLAIMIGTLIYFVSIELTIMQSVVSYRMLYEICGALAVGLTMFLMLLLRMEHPPAAGLALGLVLEAWTTWTILIILSAIILLSLLKVFLRDWLKQLAR